MFMHLRPVPFFFSVSGYTYIHICLPQRICVWASSFERSPVAVIVPDVVQLQKFAEEKGITGEKEELVPEDLHVN